MKSKRQEEILALIQEQNIETQNQLIEALRKRGVKHLKVCYSTEEAHICSDPDGQPIRTPGSISFVPGTAGLLIAGEVIRTLAGIQG